MRGSVGRTSPLCPGSWREGLVRASYNRRCRLSLEVGVGERGVDRGHKRVRAWRCGD